MFIPRPSDKDHLQRMLLDETPSSKPDLIPFTYNPLHDLESIWWVATFLIFHRFTIGGHDRRLLDADVAKLFPMGKDKQRSLALTSEGIYQEMINHLPRKFQQHRRKLNIFRQLLLHHYTDAESKADINTSPSVPTLHNILGTVFLSLRDEPGSSLAKMHTSVDEGEKVNNSFGDFSGTSAGQEMANKQTCTSNCVVDHSDSRENAIPRRSTRLQKVMPKPVTNDYDKQFQFSHSPRKQKEVNDRKDDGSLGHAECSHPAKAQKRVVG